MLGLAGLPVDASWLDQPAAPASQPGTPTPEEPKPDAPKPDVPRPASPGAEQLKADLPTPDALFARHLEAIGGLEAFKAKKNCLSEGTITTPDRSFFALYSSINVARNKLQVRIEVPGTGSETRIFNGEYGWVVYSTNSAKVLVAEDLLDLAQAADLHAMVEHDEVYKNAVTLGENEVRGEACYTVQADNRYGAREKLHFSKQTGLLHALETKSGTPDRGQQPLFIIQREYKSFDGILVPTMITQEDSLGNLVNIKITKVKFDIPDADVPDFTTPQWLLDALKKAEDERAGDAKPGEAAPAGSQPPSGGTPPPGGA